MVELGEDPLERVDTGGSSRLIWLGLAAIIVVGGLGLVAVNAMSSVVDSVSSSDEPLSTTTTLVSSTIFEPPESNPSMELVTTTAPSQVTAVVSSPSGENARLVVFTPDGGQHEIPLPSHQQYAFDASGQWLAAIDRTSGEPHSPGGLLVGPVGGDLALVAVGVTSFDWHHRDPGRIAWQLDSDEIVVSQLGLGPEVDFTIEAQFDSPADGVLGDWGAWGFALSFDTGRSVVVRDDGWTLVNVAGFVAGEIDGRLLLSGSGREPSLIDPQSGAASPARWLDDDVVVHWVSAIPSSTQFAAVQYTQTDDDGLSQGRVALVDLANEISISWAAPAPAPFTWGPLGNFAVFATQGDGVEDELSVLRLILDGAPVPVNENRLPVLQSLDDDSVVQAVSVRSPFATLPPA